MNRDSHATVVNAKAYCPHCRRDERARLTPDGYLRCEMCSAVYVEENRAQRRKREARR